MDVEHRPARARGFTLIELVTTLSLALVLLAVGVPLWRTIAQNNSLAVASNQMRSILALARNTAVTQQVPATLCPTRDQSTCSNDYTAWADGYMLFIDTDGDRTRSPNETIVRLITPAASGVQIHSSSGRKALRYGADGGAWGSNATLRFCTPGNHQNRALILTGSGRVRKSDTTSSGQPVTC